MNRGPRRVYFIKPIGMDGPIKIGCSVAPDGRRATLEQWSPFPLEVVAEIDGDFGLETRFHCAFAESWRGREWFNVTPELTATIEAIKAGSFDLDALPAKPLNKGKFRKPADRTYCTDEFRYRMSVQGRIRHRLDLSERLDRILGHRHYSRHATPELYASKRDEIEALFAQANLKAAA